MKTKKYFFISLLFVFLRCGAAYIGYDPTQVGLTGDKLMQYTKALWVAHQHNMPFVYAPFEYSDKLHLHYLNETPACESTSKITVTIPKQLHFEKNVLNLIDYYYQDTMWDPLKVATWRGLIDNQQFLTKLKQHISPAFEVKKHLIPSNRVSVAVHVRKGNGNCPPLYSEGNSKNSIYYADKVWPMKFPPDSYYVDQIKKLSLLLDDMPMYVYIFTDHINPTQILNRYKNAIGKPNIIYDCQKDGIPDGNPLQDFFAMTQYDCLIRGGSNFTQMVHLIGNFEIIIYLNTAIWSGNNMILDAGIIDNRITKD